jgi:protocatechuate 3,4-dioxygenase beta subunit
MRTMRGLLLAVLAMTFTFAQAPAMSQAPAAASLTGRVTTGSGTEVRPVRRARVTLTGGGLTAPRLADTDTRGVYRFDRLPAGAQFKIAVQKPGFVKLETDAAPNAELKMERAGAIEGVVTDASGDPIWNVVVSALQRPEVRAGAAPGPPKAIAQTRTDDLGRYRLHSLAAGDYAIEASTDRTFVVGLFLMQGEKRPEVSRAYYPASATIDDAKMVRVVAGRDDSAIDITFSPPPPAIDPAAPPAPPRPDATGTARIAGTVVDAVSGKPIKAQLLLVPVDGQRLTHWIRTDAKGRFEYTNLQSRRYTLRAQADRFVTLEYGQQRPAETGVQIQLRDGEDYRADMKLPRTSAIEGTLLDEFGDPAPSVTVQACVKGYAAGRHRLGPIGNRIAQIPTDDRGHYRIPGLPPADYFVVGLSGVYTEASEVGGFAPTYFPGTPDAGAATPITVAFGADSAGTTFALTPAKTFTVSGTLIDGDGRPVSGRGTLSLNSPDRLQRMDFNVARAATAPDGTFVLRNVPQGLYTLQGFAPPPPDYKGPLNLAAMAFAWLPIAVGDTDLDGVVLKATSGTTLRGRVVLEDSSVPPPSAEQIHVSTFQVEFDSAPMGGGPAPSETHADLTFATTRQYGIRRVYVSSSSPSWTLRKITLNGMDITDVPLDLRTRDVEGVEVLLTPKVSRIAGTVADDKGPISDYAVVLFASDPTKWIDRSRFVVMARPTQQGRFTVTGLPPEEYLAIAVPSIVGAEYMDPEFLQQLRINATAFTLTDGESKTLDLKLKRRP